MKILHILDHSVPLHSGYSFRTLAILRTQASLGWETAQITSAKHIAPGPSVERVDGFTFHRTLPWGGQFATFPVLGQLSVIQGLARRLDEVIDSIRPDILHAHSPSLNGVAGLRAARRHNIPLVYEVRALWEDGAVDHGVTDAGGPRYRATRALETYVLRRADAVTTICEGLRREILGRGVLERDVTVIPNAVDAADFAPGAVKDMALAASLGLEHARVLGFIGSFYGYEGLALLLDALPLMLARDPNVRILLVGGGPEETKLKARAVELGLERNVVFAGRVPHDRVRAYYDLIDVMIYPRLPVRVTELVTPLKPLEAMAQGRLVVASDVGGQRELIRDRVTGLLFQAGHVESLAATALEALAISERTEIRDAARKYVATERTWAASVRRYESVYRRLIGRTQGSH